MPQAARGGDATTHPGTVVPTVGSVLINGRPVATVGDLHVCAFPGLPPHPASTIATGSGTVWVVGRQAARVGDAAGCGAVIISGSPNVVIGG